MLSHDAECTCPRCKEVEYPEVQETQKVGIYGSIRKPISIFYKNGYWQVRYEVEEGVNPYIMPLSRWETIDNA